MKSIHHYPPKSVHRPSRFDRAVFGVVIALAATVLGLLFLAGCAGPGLTQFMPTSGGRLRVDRVAVAPLPVGIEPETKNATAREPMETLQFVQGENANSPSTIETGPQGEMRVTFGTVAKPQLAIPPAPDYTQYICLAAGIVFIGGGIALACYGWPQIGVRLTIAGAAMVVLALTIKSYGWAYVLAVAVAAGYIVWEKYHGYSIGVAQASLQPKQA